nr:RNA-directed DNA polymerase, eukaryota, reverse transcriptase zinc-binding domain protein [Tanacetum cinerariifolium]
MTKVTDLEANLEQFKIEQAAINSEAAKQRALLQETIEKNKVEADRQFAEIMRVLKTLQPDCFKESAKEDSSNTEGNPTSSEEDGTDSLREQREDDWQPASETDLQDIQDTVHNGLSHVIVSGRPMLMIMFRCNHVSCVTTQITDGKQPSITPDAFDEYLQMSEHTARDALFFFNMCIIELYMPKYLRKPTSEDVVNIQQKHNNVHGFSRMLGSIDSGANNDIIVLDNSPLFDDLLDDLAPTVSYVVNGRQKSARKDVERAFGVLQGRWGLIQQPARAYEVNTLRKIILLTYFMSIYKVPVSICSKLESMRNKFFIGSEIGKKKLTWVIKAIHGHNGGIHVESMYSPIKDTWSGILSKINSLKLKGIDLLSLRNSRGGIEASQLMDLQNLIRDVVLSDHNDSWTWSSNISKGYSVASARHLIDSHILDIIPNATRWNRNIPIKANVFLWRLSLNKVPSRANLDKKKRTKRLGKSGENDVDVLKRAQSIYRDEHKRVAFCQEDAWAILKFHPKWGAPAQVDLTGDVPGATQEDLSGHDARPRPAGKPRPAKKTKSDATASIGGSSASTQFEELMEQKFRLEREAAERNFEAQAERDRTLMRLEELRFLANSTKDLDEDDAYWIKKQKRVIKNQMRNDLGDEDDEDEYGSF